MSAEFDSLFDALKLDPPGDQRVALGLYLDLLQRWNGTYNLTAVRTRDSMRIQHIADCLAAVTPLALRSDRGTLLDVGSGGGLPGIVFAILHPDREVTCVDAVGKKAAFIQQVQAVLKLKNLKSVHARVELLEGLYFDVIVSRAFGSLSALVTLTQNALNPGGVWAAMKGQYPRHEIHEVSRIADVFHVEQLKVPELVAERCLVWMQAKQNA